MTTQQIILSAKNKLETLPDTDYSSNKEIKDLIENYDKASLINLIIILAKQLSFKQ